MTEGRRGLFSACDTGCGRLQGSELVGLARGAALRGARASVVSLWPVDDVATAMLMEFFHEELRGSEPPARALWRAQLRLQQTSAEEALTYFTRAADAYAEASEALAAAGRPGAAERFRAHLRTVKLRARQARRPRPSAFEAAAPLGGLPGIGDWRLSNALTPRELALSTTTRPAPADAEHSRPTLPLEGERLAWLERLLEEDESLAGVEVLAPDGASLGVVPSRMCSTTFSNTIARPDARRARRPTRRRARRRDARSSSATRTSRPTAACLGRLAATARVQSLRPRLCGAPRADDAPGR